MGFEPSTSTFEYQYSLLTIWTFWSVSEYCAMSGLFLCSDQKVDEIGVQAWGWGWDLWCLWSLASLCSFAKPVFILRWHRPRRSLDTLGLGWHHAEEASKEYKNIITHTLEPHEQQTSWWLIHTRLLMVFNGLVAYRLANFQHVLFFPKWLKVAPESSKNPRQQR